MSTKLKDLLASSLKLLISTAPTKHAGLVGVLKARLRAFDPSLVLPDSLTEAQAKLATAEQALLLLVAIHDAILSLPSSSSASQQPQPPLLGSRDVNAVSQLGGIVSTWGLQPLLADAFPETRRAASKSKIVELESIDADAASEARGKLWTALEHLAVLLGPSDAGEGTKGKGKAVLRAPRDELRAILMKCCGESTARAFGAFTGGDEVDDERRKVARASLDRLLDSIPVTLALTYALPLVSLFPQAAEARATFTTLLNGLLSRPGGVRALLALLLGGEEELEIGWETRAERVAQLVFATPTTSTSDARPAPALQLVHLLYSAILNALPEHLYTEPRAPSPPTGIIQAAVYILARGLEMGRISSADLAQLLDPPAYAPPASTVVAGEEERELDEDDEVIEVDRTVLSAKDTWVVVLALALLLSNAPPGTTEESEVDRLVRSKIGFLWGLAFFLDPTKPAHVPLLEEVEGLLHLWSRKVDAALAVKGVSTALEQLEGGLLFISDDDSLGETYWAKDMESGVVCLRQRSAGTTPTEPPDKLAFDPVRIVDYVVGMDRPEVVGKLVGRWSGELMLLRAAALAPEYQVEEEEALREAKKSLMRLNLVLTLVDRIGPENIVGSEARGIIQFVAYALDVKLLQENGQTEVLATEVKEKQPAREGLEGLLFVRDEEGSTAQEQAGVEEAEPGETGLGANEMAITAVTLLLAALEQDEDMDTTNTPVLALINDKLEGPEQDTGELLAPLAKEARTVLSLRKASALGGGTETDSTTPDKFAASRKRYQEALKLLQDALLPVRAQGLSILHSLVATKEAFLETDPALLPAVLDIFVTAVEEEDSFLYLNAVKGLSALVDGYGKPVATRLVKLYTGEGKGVGEGEKGRRELDKRLRIGETLVQVIQRAGEAFSVLVDVIVPPLLAVLSSSRLPTALRSSTLTVLTTALETAPVAMAAYSDVLCEACTTLLSLETSPLPPRPAPGPVATSSLKPESKIAAGSVVLEDGEDLSSSEDEDLPIPSTNTSDKPKRPEDTPDPLTLDTKHPVLRRAAVLFLGILFRILSALLQQERERMESRASASHNLETGLTNMSLGGASSQHRSSSGVAMGMVRSENISRARTVLGYLSATDRDALVRQQAQLVIEEMDETRAARAEERIRRVERVGIGAAPPGRRKVAAMNGTPASSSRKPAFLSRQNWSRKSVVELSGSDQDQQPDSRPSFDNSQPSSSKNSLDLRRPSAGSVVDASHRNTPPPPVPPRRSSSSLAHARGEVGRIMEEEPPPQPKMSLQASEERVIESLVQRIAARLPVRSGVRMTDVASDKILSTSLRSLQAFSRLRIATILQKLHSQLATITKGQAESDNATLPVLQSRLILLQLIAGVIYKHWSYLPSLRKPVEGRPATFRDPPPLPDTIAKDLFMMCCFFLRYHAASDHASHHHSTFLLAESGAVTCQRLLLNAAAGSSAGEQARGSPVDANSRLALIAETARHAGAVTYFLAAANWQVVFARLKNRFAHYVEETADLTEVRLVEWCCLDRRRLGAVVQELSASFPQFRRTAQQAMAGPIRRMLLSFAVTSPSFGDLHQSGRRLEGNTDALFDHVHALSENGKRKLTLPLMADLLVFCPDLLSQILLAEAARASGVTKKSQFLENLRKTLRSGKPSTAGATACLDICLMASFTEPSQANHTSLRFLTSDLLPDLIKNLLDPTRTFSSEENSGSEPLLAAEGLVAFYRLEPNAAVATFVSFLNRRGANEEDTRLAAVKAIERLARAQTGPERVPWHPPLDRLVKAVAGTVRQSFFGVVSSARELRTSTKERPESNVKRDELLHAIFRAWQAEPSLLVVDQDPTNAETSFEGIAWKVATLLDDWGYQGVREEAVRTLFRLYETSEAAVAQARSRVSSRLSVDICNALCRYALDAKADSLEESASFDLLQLELGRVAAFLRSAGTSDRQQFIATHEWTTMFDIVTIPLLLGICSANVAVRRAAITCASRLHEIREAASLPAGLGCSFLSSDIHRAINANHDGVDSANLYQLLRATTMPSIGTLYAWDEAYRRWKTLSIVLFAQSPEKDVDLISGQALPTEQVAYLSKEDQSEEWGSLLGCIVALASFVCRDDCKNVLFDDSLTSTTPPLRFGRPRDRSRIAMRSIQELVDLVVARDFALRDLATSALGRYLGGDICPWFMSHLRTIMSRFLEQVKTGSLPTGDCGRFLRQGSEIVWLAFERTDDMPNAHTASTATQLLISFMRHLSLVPKDDADGIRPMLCNAVKALMIRRRDLSPAPSAPSRMTMLHFLLKWGQSPSTVASGPQSPKEGVRMSKASADECLAAMVPVVDGLATASERNGSGTTDSAKTDLAVIVNLYHFFAQAYPNESQPEQRRDLVEVLAHVLAANPEFAYPRFLDMSTAAHPDLRAGYLQVLARMVELGVSLEAAPADSSSEAWDRLVTLVTQPDMSLAMVLCDVANPAHSEDLIDVLLKIFHFKGSATLFLKALIEKEISETDHESTLFRGNSFATKALTAFARARGHNYLRKTLSPLLLMLSKSPPNFSMNFDPHQQTAADDASSRNLEHVTEAFLVTLINSIDQVPPEIREICHYISELVGNRFPESVFTAVGGFAFLRFINPAIVTPSIIDLDIPTENREVRRAMVMISKVLQALANNVRFGAKEPGMRKLNDFMDRNIFSMARFLQSISQFDSTSEPQPVEPFPFDPSTYSVDASDQEYFRAYVVENLEKVGQAVAQPKSGGSKASKSYDRLCELVAGTSPQAEVPASRETDVAVDEDLFETIFYETTKTDESTLFCFALHRVNAIQINLTGLVEYILRKMTAQKGSMEVLVDCTGFKTENELPVAIFGRSWSLPFVNVLRGVTKVYVLNPSTAFKRYLRSVGRAQILEEYDSRNVVCATTLPELAELLPTFNPNEHLPEGTLRLEREYYHTLGEAAEVYTFRPPDRVLLTAGPDTLCVTTAKKHDLFGDIKATLRDFVSLAAITEVVNGTATSEESIVHVRISGCESPRAFSHESKYPLTQDLIQSQRGRDTVLAPPLPQPRPFPAERILGAVIALAMFNVATDEPGLRSASYHLLSVAAETARLEGVSELFGLPGVAVPDTHYAFLSSISERLATSAPQETLSVLAFSADLLARVGQTNGSLFALLLRPWLYNLAGFHGSRERVALCQTRLRRLMRQLVGASISDSSVATIVQSRLAPAISKNEVLCPLFLEDSVQLGVACGLDSQEARQVTNIILGMSTVLSVRGRLVTRLLDALRRTGSQPYMSIDQSPQFGTIAFLTRCHAALSFEASLQAELYLPELFHACTMLVGTNSKTLRQDVYSVLLNTTHALLQARVRAADPERVRRLMAELRDCSKECMTAGDVTTAFQWHSKFEGFISLLLRIIEAGASSIDLANTWRARWMSLVASTCFQTNPALQPRAFIVLACLARDEVDDDICFQMMTTLSSSLASGSLVDLELAALVATCLAKLVPAVGFDSLYLPSLFWVGVALLSINSPKVYVAGLDLVGAVIATLHEGQCFHEQSAHQVLLEIRDGEGFDTAFAKLESMVGVSFSSAFAFSMAVLLSKGLSSADIYEPTMALCQKLVEVSDDSVAYRLCTLPTTSGTGVHDIFDSKDEGHLILSVDLLSRLVEQGRNRAGVAGWTQALLETCSRSPQAAWLLREGLFVTLHDRLLATPNPPPAVMQLAAMQSQAASEAAIANGDGDLRSIASRFTLRGTQDPSNAISAELPIQRLLDCVADVIISSIVGK